MAGIDRDGGAVLLRQRRQRIGVRAVVEPEHDHGADTWPERARDPAPVGLRRQPVHGAVLALGEELRQARRGLGNGVGARDADGIEALGLRLGDQPALEGGRGRRAGVGARFFQGLGAVGRHGRGVNHYRRGGERAAPAVPNPGAVSISAFFSGMRRPGCGTDWDGLDRVLCTRLSVYYDWHFMGRLFQRDHIHFERGRMKRLLVVLALLMAGIAWANSQTAAAQPFDWAIGTRDPGLSDDAVHGVWFPTTPIWMNLETGRTFWLKGAGTGTAVWVTDLAAKSLALPVDVAPDHVVAAYGVRRLRAAYSGDCCVVTRQSDGRKLSLGLDVAGHVDSELAEVFCRNTACTVTTWFDQSGNGYDATSTPENAPYFGRNTLGNGVTVSFQGTKPQMLDLPEGVAITMPYASVVAAAQPRLIDYDELDQSAPFVQIGTHGSGVVFDAAVTTDKFANCDTTTTAPGVRDGDEVHCSETTLPSESGPAVYAFTSNSEGLNFWVNENTAKASATADRSRYRRGHIGFQDSDDRGYTGDMSAIIIYDAALAASERETTARAMYALFGIPPQQEINRLIVDGDSIAAGANATTFNGWPFLMAKQLQPTSFINAAHSGDTCKNLEAIFSTNIAARRLASARNNVLLIGCGSNDIAIGKRTAQQTWRDLRTYIRKAAKAGFAVVPVTMLPRGDAKVEAQRVRFNSLIRARAGASGAVRYCDFAASRVMGRAGDNTDTTYYDADAIHPNDRGHEELAGIAKGCVEALLTR